MTRKGMSVFVLVVALLTLSITSISMKTSAQQEMVPKWTYEDGGWFTRVAISADGNYIGVGTNNTNKFYLFRSNVSLWNYTVGSVHSISMSSDGKYVAVGADGNFFLFNRENSSYPLFKYSVDYSVSIVAISSDGKYAVMGATSSVSQQNAESRLYVFERGQSQPSWIKTLPGVLESLSMSSSGNYFVASTSLPGVIYLFSREQEAPLWSYSFGERSGGAKISNDGSYVVAVGGNQSGDDGMRIYMFYRQNSTPRYMKIAPELPSRWGLSVSSNGSIFAVSYTSRSQLFLFDMNVRPYGPKSIRVASLPVSGVHVSMSSDGRYIFVGASGGMFVYEYLNNELSLKWQYTNSGLIVNDIACSSDGKHVVAVGASGLFDDEHSRIYFFEMKAMDNLWASWAPVIVVVIVVVIAGVAGLIFHRSYRRNRGKH